MMHLTRRNFVGLSLGTGALLVAPRALGAERPYAYDIRPGHQTHPNVKLMMAMPYLDGVGLHDCVAADPATGRALVYTRSAPGGVLNVVSGPCTHARDACVRLSAFNGCVLLIARRGRVEIRPGCDLVARLTTDMRTTASASSGTYPEKHDEPQLE